MIRAAKRVEAISHSILADFRRYALETPGAVSIAIGDPDFAPPEFIREAIKKAVDEGQTHYTHPAGLPDLRKAISNKLRKENGIEADPDSGIVVTAGATEAIHVVLQALVENGDEVIVPDPCYTYAEQVKFSGGVPICVPAVEENAFRPKLDDIRKAITKKTKIIAVYLLRDNPLLIQSLSRFLKNRLLLLHVVSFREMMLYCNVYFGRKQFFRRSHLRSLISRFQWPSVQCLQARLCLRRNRLGYLEIQQL